jgi:hypothetical protein
MLILHALNHMIQRLASFNAQAMPAFEKESRELWMRIDETQLTLALVNKHTGTWDAAEVLHGTEGDYETDFEAGIRQQSTLAGFSGLQTKLFFSTPTAMPVPLALQSSAKLFMEAQFGRVPTQVLFTDLVNEEITIAYSPDPTRQAVLQKWLPQASWHSTLSLLIRQMLKISVTTTSPIVCLYLCDGFAELAMGHSSRLLLTKHLHYGTDTNLLYHLLNACRQLATSPTEIVIQLQGRIPEEANTVQLLKQYFSHVAFSPAGYPSDHSDFHQVPAHFFTGLMEETL